VLWKFKQEVHIFFQVRCCRWISTIRENVLSPFSGTNIFTWMCRQHGPPKRRYPLSRLHGITLTHRPENLRLYIASIGLVSTTYNGLKLSHLLVSFNSSFKMSVAIIVWYGRTSFLDRSLILTEEISHHKILLNAEKDFHSCFTAHASKQHNSSWTRITTFNKTVFCDILNRYLTLPFSSV
jgi:hypothetical protein